MQKEATLGFRASSLQDRENLNDVHEHNKTAAKDALKRIMRPELINRFDDIIVFRALTRREVSKIFDILIGDLQKRLMQKGLRLIVDPSLKRDIIKKGYDEQYGARPLRRVIQDTIEHAIAEGILRNTYDKGTVLRARLDKHKVVIEEAKEE
jgi:ATP-dependent Clp protease ATP-binding subunit ClpA